MIIAMSQYAPPQIHNANKCGRSKHLTRSGRDGLVSRLRADAVREKPSQSASRPPKGLVSERSKAPKNVHLPHSAACIPHFVLSAFHPQVDIWNLAQSPFWPQRDIGPMFSYIRYHPMVV
jgi:hypothetical protein